MPDDLSRREAWHTAIHEAGHACAVLNFDLPLTKVSIEETADRYGSTQWKGVVGRAELVIVLVGYLAEGTTPVADCRPDAVVRTWPPSYEEAKSDTVHEGGYVGRLIRDLGLSKAQYNEVVGAAYSLVAREDFRRQVEVVARALIRHRSLSGARVEAIIAAHVPKPKEPSLVPAMSVAEARLLLAEAEL